MAIGGSVTGNIEAAWDADWFAINLVEGSAYAFDLEGSTTSQGTLDDPDLRLRNQAGSVVGHADDGGQGTNSRLVYTPTISGSYFLDAQNYSSRTGTYRLSAKLIDDYAGYNRLPIGSSITGNIETSSDTDSFIVTMEGGVTYTFDLEGASASQGTLVDPYLSLTDSTGFYSFGFALGAHLVYTPSPRGGGEYYLRAQSWYRSGSPTGTYRLSVKSNAPTPSVPTDLDLSASDDSGASNSDNITSQTSGLTISGSSGVSGSTLVLFDDKNNDGIIGSGEALVTTSITAASWNADISLTTGTHNIRAIQSNTSGSSPVSTGLSITIQAPDDYAGNSSTTGRLSIGSSVAGNIEAGSDVDWFAITLTAGIPYTFDLEGSPTSQGTLNDPLLILYDQNSVEVARNDDATSENVNSRIIYTPLSSGSYFLSAKGYSSYTGSYRLSVSLPAIPAAPTSLDLSASDDSGASNSDNITSQTSGLTISGSSGTTGASLVLFDDKNNDGAVGSDEALVTTSITAATWSADISLTPGTHAIKAIQSNTSGSSAASTALTITVDTTAPSVPTVTLENDSGSSTTDRITNRGTVAVAGTETGATLQYSSNGGSSWASTSTAVSGSNSVLVRQVDAAGNTSAPSAALTFTLDNTAPTLSSSTPADNAATVAADANVVLVFSETVTAGAGNVVISSGSDSRTIAVTDSSQISISGATVTINPTASLNAGTTYSVQMAAGVLRDVAGNHYGGISDAATLNFAVANVPSAPTSLDLASADDSGTSNSDNITSQTSGLTISGSGGVSGNTLVLFNDKDNDGVADNGEALVTTSIAAAAWSADISLIAGTHAVRAIQSNTSGNGSASTALTITVDTIAPAAPTVTLENDSGVSTTDRITNREAVVVAGTETGATLQYSSDGGSSWASVFTAVPGGNSVLVRQVDAAGNVGATSAALNITFDTTVLAPSNLDLAATDDGGLSSSDNLTNQTSALTITGQGEVGASVTLFVDRNDNGSVDEGESLTTATVTAAGLWSGDISLTSGTQAIRAVQVDVAGNSSGSSTALILTIDATAPLPPTAVDMVASDDSGLLDHDNITNKTATIRFTGSGENGATVILFDDDSGEGIADINERWGTAVVTNGSWSVVARVWPGEHDIKTTQIDAAGNGSVASTALAIVIDPSAPLAPTGIALASEDDSGFSSSDAVTNRTTGLTIGGRGEKQALLRLFDDRNDNGEVDSGEPLTTVTVAATGQWSADIALATDSSYRIKAIQSDRAGNSSVTSVALIVSVDATLPDRPGLSGNLSLAAADDSGLLNDDRITRQSSGLTIGGSGETGAYVSLFDDRNNDGGINSGELLTTTIVTANNWNADITLTAGSHVIKAIQTSLSGNVSSASNGLLITVDNEVSPPAGLDLAADDDSGRSNSDNIVRNSFDLMISGTGEEGAYLTLFDDRNNNGRLDDGELLETTQVSRGVWHSEIEDGLVNGAHNVRAVQVDLAGNVSTASAALSITVDSFVSALTGLRLDVGSDSGVAGDGVTNRNSVTVVGGGAEQGADIALYESGSRVGAATATADGDWRITLTGLTAGRHSWLARQTDIAGNVSSDSALLLVTVDNSTPATPSGLNLMAADDNGSSNNDRITSQTRDLTVSGGSGETGATLVLFEDRDNNGVAQNSEILATAAVTGTFWNADLNLDAGSYSIRAVQMDAAGNSSAASDALNMAVINTISYRLNNDAMASGLSAVGSAKADTLTLFDAGTTFTISAIETVVGSDEEDVIALMAAASVNCSGVEGVLGSSAAKPDTVTLLTSAAMTVSNIESIVGSKGVDTVTLLDSNRLFIKAVETIVGSDEVDTVVMLSSGSVAIQNIDSLVGSGGNDSVRLLDGAYVTLSKVKTVLGSDGEDVVILASAGNITIVDVDSVIGSSGNDTITIGSNNTLEFTVIGAGRGADKLSAAGKGSVIQTVFLYADAAESSSTSKDTISNFTIGRDRIQISDGLRADGNSGDFTVLAAGQKFSGSSNTEVRFTDSSKLMELDWNGDKKADMAFTLSGVKLADLKANDPGGWISWSG
ncbi:MAG: Ig-like domain-containing protein [Magnetococcales bacterium]|nr:Ig-like domain-containing protein [Magnetococcales bacterium]